MCLLATTPFWCSKEGWNFHELSWKIHVKSFTAEFSCFPSIFFFRFPSNQLSIHKLIVVATKCTSLVFYSQILGISKSRVLILPDLALVGSQVYMDFSEFGRVGLQCFGILSHDLEKIFWACSPLFSNIFFPRIGIFMANKRSRFVFNERNDNFPFDDEMMIFFFALVFCAIISQQNCGGAPVNLSVSKCSRFDGGQKI